MGVLARALELSTTHHVPKDISDRKQNRCSHAKMPIVCRLWFTLDELCTAVQFLPPNPFKQYCIPCCLLWSSLSDWLICSHLQPLPSLPCSSRSGKWQGGTRWWSWHAMKPIYLHLGSHEGDHNSDNCTKICQNNLKSVQMRTVTGSAPCPSKEIRRTTVHVSNHSYDISRNYRSIAVALLWLDIEVVSRNITPRDRHFTQSDSLDPCWARNTTNEVVKGVVKFIERGSRYPRLSPHCAAIHT